MDDRPQPLKITEPIMLMHDLTARPTSTGFVAVDLGFEADPIMFTPEVIEEEKRRLGGEDSWQWQKEYMRNFTAQSGQPLFEREWIDWQRKTQRNPAYCMMFLPSGKLEKCKNGPVKIFIDPKDRPEGLPESVVSVDRQFAIGADTGEGVGGNDSTMVGGAVDTMEQAFEYRTNKTRPDEFGKQAAQLARHYNGALICPVRKGGHGIACIRAIVDSGYSRVWREKNPRTYVQVSTNLLGWPHGEVTQNNFLLDNYIRALRDHLIILHGVDTIGEHSQFIYDDLGRPVISKFKEMPSEARARHGDLVIAAALCYRAMLDLPLYRHVVNFQANVMNFETRRRLRQKAAKKLDRRAW